MLGCIVLGEKNAFPVDFNTGKTIGHLKIVIKEQVGLDSPAHKLKLWKINIPESEKHKIYEGIDVKVKFGEQRPIKRLKLETEVGDPSFNDLLEVVAHLKRESTNWKKLDFIEHPIRKDLPIIQQPKLYIREDYKALYQIVNKEELDPKFLINGTSGIGKSYFLLYLLIQILCSSNDVTVIFQTTQSELFYRFKNSKLGVGSFEDISYCLYDPNTWYLVDAMPPAQNLRQKLYLLYHLLATKKTKTLMNSLK
ncbi:13055_t:CDS:2 [Funneliformis mosseae]|uniref:13055_t:CDS:1 n=1 Tax=Funneliformis mosseae TaxID=27381 RepID=A0A9N8ZWD1_FUNMO|nr:13055_t:CDS:2 [Funneliformis mosseae]